MVQELPPIQMNLTGRFSKEGQAELPAYWPCSQAGQPPRALPEEEFCPGAGLGCCPTSLSTEVPLVPIPPHSESYLLGRAITADPSSTPVCFHLQNCPLTSPGHLNVLCPEW